LSKEALARIEKAIESLCEGQAKLSEELQALSSRVTGLAEQDDKGPISKQQLLRFLDRFRGGEALGEAGLGAWIASCQTDCLRGGLRTIQLREGFHARLLEQRMKELGGTPEYEVPDAVQNAYLESVGSHERTDVDKLRDFVSQVGSDVDKALQPIYEVANRLDHDPETQSLLRTIAQDERSTLEFINEACELLGVS
jgi:hypothetical protein